MIRKIMVDGEPLLIRRGALERLREGYGRAGEHDPGVITLAARGLTRRQERVTVIHEMLHELFVRSDLRGMFPIDDEELVCDTLATWLYDVLHDNPRLVTYLTERI